MIKTVFNNNQNPMSKTARRFLIFGGINLVLLSIVVFVYPEILAYAVASLFLIGGITLIGLGLRIKRQNGQNGQNPNYRDDHGQTIHFNY